MSDFKAYVGFVDGEIHMEHVIDDHGTFIGLNVFRSLADAQKRYEDVRQVTLKVGRRTLGKPGSESK